MAHGPVVRSHEHDLPKRVRRLGLLCALSAKAWERRLLVVESLQPAEGKTVGGAGGAAAPGRVQPAVWGPANGLLAVAAQPASSMHPAGLGKAEALLPPASRALQKEMQAAVDALLAGAPRRSALLCDSSKQGEDGG